MEDFSDIRAGYRILFAFEENPYFSDKELSKSFTYSEDAQLLCSSPGIHWYPGKVNATSLELWLRAHPAAGCPLHPCQL